jgi:hypothetical protein
MCPKKLEAWLYAESNAGAMATAAPISRDKHRVMVFFNLQFLIYNADSETRPLPRPPSSRNILFHSSIRKVALYLFLCTDRSGYLTCETSAPALPPAEQLAFPHASSSRSHQKAFYVLPLYPVHMPGVTLYFPSPLSSTHFRDRLYCSL